MTFQRETRCARILQKVLSFCKFSGTFLFLMLFLGIIGFYFYYWFIYQDTSAIEEVDEEEVVITVPEEAENQLHETEENIEEIAEEEITESDNAANENISVEEHLLLKMDVSQQPDIYDVIHVSRLISLENFMKETFPQSSAKKPFLKKKNSNNSSRAKIAIIIDDMGASPGRTNKILEIKAPLTSSFVTFASQLTRQVNKAKQAGHEIMIHVPMQPKANIFVSDDVLTVDMTPEQISQAFEKMLQKFDKPVGVNNHMGSKFTEYADKLAPVMQLLAKHKMFFLDSKTTPNSQGEVTAKKYGVPTVHRHVFLDNKDELEYILGQLEKTEKIAQKNGYAIAIGHPKIQTDKALKVWIKTLKKKGVELVWLSELVKQ